MSLGQTIEITRGKSIKNQYNVNCLDGGEIKGKYCFLLSKATINFSLDIFNSNLELEKSIPFSKPKGYYYLTAKFKGDYLYFFVYGKNKETKQTNVIVIQYDPLSGEIINQKPILDIASYKSKIKVKMDNEEIFSIYSTADDGHLSATCFNSSLEILQKDKIILPEYIPKGNQANVFHATNGTLLAFYTPKTEKEQFQGCMITSKKNKINIVQKNYGAGAQFGLKVIDMNNFYLFISKTNNLVYPKSYVKGANTMNTLEIYKYTHLEPTRLREINIYKDLSQPIEKAPDFSINKIMAYGNKITSSILTYDDCIIVDGKLKYLILKNFTWDNSISANYSSNGSVIIGLESNTPKYYPLAANLSVSKDNIGMHYVTSIDSNSLIFVYPHSNDSYSYGDLKKLADNPIVYTKIDSKTITNDFLSPIVSDLYLFEDNFILSIVDSYKTKTGIIYYEATLDVVGTKSLRRIVKIDIIK